MNYYNSDKCCLLLQNIYIILDCKTVIVLCWSYECMRSFNKRSETRVNMESGIGERDAKN